MEITVRRELPLGSETISGFFHSQIPQKHKSIYIRRDKQFHMGKEAAFFSPKAVGTCVIMCLTSNSWVHHGVFPTTSICFWNKLCVKTHKLWETLSKIRTSQSLLKRISLIQKFEGNSGHQTALPFLATIQSTNSLGQLSCRSFLSVHYPELLPTNSSSSQQNWSHAIRPPLISSLTSWTHSHSLGNFSIREMACLKKKKAPLLSSATLMFSCTNLSCTRNFLASLGSALCHKCKFSSCNLILSSAPITLRSPGSCLLLFSPLWAPSSFTSFPNQPRPHNPSFQLTACRPGSQFPASLPPEFIQEAENHHRRAHKCH